MDFFNLLRVGHHAIFPEKRKPMLGGLKSKWQGVSA